MSASEKLRALSTYGQHLGMLPRYAVGAKMGEVNPPDNIVSWERYRDVLPQIVAVVEAAEWISESGVLSFDRYEALCDSLGALDQALE